MGPHRAIHRQLPDRHAPHEAVRHLLPHGLHHRRRPGFRRCSHLPHEKGKPLLELVNRWCWTASVNKKDIHVHINISVCACESESFILIKCKCIFYAHLSHGNSKTVLPIWVWFSFLPGEGCKDVKVRFSKCWQNAIDCCQWVMQMCPDSPPTGWKGCGVNTTPCFSSCHSS